MITAVLGVTVPIFLIVAVGYGYGRVHPDGIEFVNRINLTLYKLDFIMDGDLLELTNALAAEHQAEQLAALGDSGAGRRSAGPLNRLTPQELQVVRLAARIRIMDLGVEVGVLQPVDEGDDPRIHRLAHFAAEAAGAVEADQHRRRVDAHRAGSAAPAPARAFEP